MGKKDKKGLKGWSRPCTRHKDVQVGVQVEPSFLTSEPDGGRGQPHTPTTLPHIERVPITYWTGVHVGT